MKYKYVGEGAYFSGLPATDLDDNDLTEDQKWMLEQAVAMGLYVAVTPSKAKQKEKPTDGEETGV